MKKIIVLIALSVSISAFAGSGVTIAQLEGAWWADFGNSTAEFAIQNGQVWMDYDSKYHPCKVDGDILVFDLGEGLGSVRHRIISLDGNTLILENSGSKRRWVLTRVDNAGEVVQYHLIPEKVVRAELLEGQEEPTVIIKLDEQETVRFAKLTKSSIGKMLQVILNGQVLIEAVVKAEIDSGSMSARVSNELEAKQLIQKLNSRQN